MFDHNELWILMLAIWHLLIKLTKLNARKSLTRANNACLLFSTLTGMGVKLTDE